MLKTIISFELCISSIIMCCTHFLPARYFQTLSSGLVVKYLLMHHAKRIVAAFFPVIVPPQSSQNLLECQTYTCLHYKIPPLTFYSLFTR